MRVATLLLSLAILGMNTPTVAQTREGAEMDTVRVRYMVNAIDPAVEFYKTYLGFEVKQGPTPNFAILSRGHLELVLSTPFGPGGAAQPMPDGRRAEPGGWNRIIVTVPDLPHEVDRLQKAHLHFRSGILNGPGGSEIVLDDPSGNPIELFQPSASQVEGRERTAAPVAH